VHHIGCSTQLPQTLLQLKLGVGRARGRPAVLIPIQAGTSTKLRVRFVVRRVGRHGRVVEQAATGDGCVGNGPWTRARGVSGEVGDGAAMVVEAGTAGSWSIEAEGGF
jgi:hypothetical protein